MDPAVGVHDARGDAVDDAVDRVADVLAGGHQQGAQHEHDDLHSEIDRYRVIQMNFLSPIYTIAIYSYIHVNDVIY